MVFGILRYFFLCEEKVNKLSFKTYNAFLFEMINQFEL